MLRNLILVLAGAAVLMAETRLGQPLTLREPLTVDQLMAAPANYAGQTVQVKGKVTEVCQMAGCWMQLAGTGKNAVRVKVNDGDIVFPRTSVGKMAVAEGKLNKIEMTKEQAVARAKHEADERGVKFSEASVKSGSTIYQIQGAGALILE
ncbi:MAG: DUF4920 domain-containing protein [Bryobacteraceae bacterium]|nr:DUF4920 domain-containing protein [Bryobacteraceae bacterium]